MIGNGDSALSRPLINFDGDSLEVFSIGFVLILWGTLFVAKSFGLAQPGPAYDSLTVLVVSLVSQYVTKSGQGRTQNSIEQGARAGTRQAMDRAHYPSDSRPPYQQAPGDDIRRPDGRPTAPDPAPAPPSKPERDTSANANASRSPGPDGWGAGEIEQMSDERADEIRREREQDTSGFEFSPGGRRNG